MGRGSRSGGGGGGGLGGGEHGEDAHACGGGEHGEEAHAWLGGGREKEECIDHQQVSMNSSLPPPLNNQTTSD